jgi:hypothetical protein
LISFAWPELQKTPKSIKDFPVRAVLSGISKIASILFRIKIFKNTEVSGQN